MKRLVKPSALVMMMGTIESGKSPVSSSASYYLRFWILLALILGTDQLSKWTIVDLSGFQLGMYPPFGGKVVIPEFLNLVYAVNYGAAWGMLEGFSWLLVVLAILVLALIAGFRKDLGFHLSANQFCFGLISGGIIGNTIDRIFRGHVVDFLDLRLPGYQWPTFNIADSAIVIGTAWYMYLQFRRPKD